MTMMLIDGNKIASRILENLAMEVTRLKSDHDTTPGLAIVMASSDPVQQNWSGRKIRTAARIDIDANLINLPRDVTERSLTHRIDEISADRRFHGIFVQLPLPDQVSEAAVRRSIARNKDVDCMHPVNVMKLMDGQDGRFSPASVLAVHEALLSVPIDLEKKHILICGQSQDAALMAAYFRHDTEQQNARITLSGPGSPEFSSQLSVADVVISMIGEPLSITADMIKPGAVVIDTGQNLITDTDRRSGYRVVGDVDFASVSSKATAITPVPGGLGPITVATLLANTVKAVQLAVGQA